MPAPKRDVLESAVILLSRREYCRYDLAMKLKQKGYTTAEIRKALTYATQNRYIDEKRYTNLYVEMALTQKHQGQKRIYADLLHKHIPENYIKEALEEFYNPFKEKQDIKELILRRTRGDFSQKSKNRVIRYLLSHGYEFSVISDVWQDILAHSSNDNAGIVR